MIRWKPTTHHPLTREEVRSKLALFAPLGQRKATKQRMAYLKGQVTNGLFHDPYWATATLPDGREFLTNGNGSCLMLDALSDAEFPRGLGALTAHCDIDTIDDLAEVFSVFDARQSSRAPHDIIGAHACHVSDSIACIPNKTLEAICAGVVWGVYEGKRQPIEILAGFPREFSDFFLWVAPLLRNGVVKMKAAVVGAMLLTHLRNKEYASAFWRAVISEDSPPNSPERVLSMFLRERQVDPVVKRKFNDRAVHAKCVIAYNASRNGRSTRLHYTEQAPIPAVVAA